MEYEETKREDWVYRAMAMELASKPQTVTYETIRKSEGKPPR